MKANQAVFPIAIMARVPWLDPGAIMKVLDGGAYGVICPMVNSRAEAERLVSYVRYPPEGTRSFGPTRVNFSAGANYGGEANDQIVCLAMIETREAYDNALRAAKVLVEPRVDLAQSTLSRLLEQRVAEQLEIDGARLQLLPAQLLDDSLREL